MSFKLKKNSVEQKINLKKLFNVDFSGQRSLRETIGQAIIDKIKSNAESGIGVSFSSSGVGRKVKLKSPYSKTYSKSLDFKAHGKSKNKVNMTLTGDMLGLMDIKKQKSNELTIGWDDKEENAKAFNHISGDTVPKRPFFGLNTKMLNEIKKEFKSEVKDIIKAKQASDKEKFNSLLLGLIDKINPKDVSGN